MSSKTKDTSMTATAQHALVPKLRFPEFRDAGEWEEKKLGELCEMRAGKFVSAGEISEENGDALYPCYGGNGLRGYVKTFTHSGKYPLIGRQGALCGNVILGEGEFHATEHAVASAPFSCINIDWLFYSLLKLDLNRFATGQAQPGLSVDVLEKVDCLVPSLESEQEKIADCLSSIDDLITLESRKIDTLKAHKKGLMQQLFPAEGETLPKLRFPEFRDAGEWEEKPLGNFIEEFRDKSTIQDEFEVLTSARNGLVRQRDYFDNDRIAERNNIGFNIIPPNYMTYRSRSDDRRFYFNENTLGITGIISIYYPVFRVIGGSNKFFTELLCFYSTKIGKHSVGTSQTVLSMNELRHIRLPVPEKAEQQKIADCLSSIDDLIALQTKKLDALKAHKKGLMQQLFPSLGEVRE